MELVLNEQQTLLRDSAARLAKDSGGPRRARKLRDAGTEIDGDAWRAAIAAGWLGTVVREEHGGLGLGALDLALAIEEAGKHLVMMPLVEAAAAAWALSQAGAAARVVELMAGGQLAVPATAAPTWSFAGAVNPGGMHASKSATLLNGSFEHVPFAGSAAMFLVDAAATAAERCIVVIPSGDIAIATRRNVDGSTSSRLTAAGVAIAADAVVARSEDAASIGTCLQELLVLWTSAELLGTASAALDMTSEYLKLRKQFGKPIGSFQALQHRMVDCFVDLELSRSLLYRVLAAWDAGEAHPAMVAACKARISRGALVTVRTAVQLHGAMGYTDEHDIGLYYKRAVALAAKYGNEICHVDSFSAATLPADARRG